MDVVEKMRERGWTFEMYAHPHPEGFTVQAHSFAVNPNAVFVGDTLAEAVCRAALQATASVSALADQKSLSEAGKNARYET